MAKGVFLTYSSYGHINSTLPIVTELIKRKEEIVYFADEVHLETLRRTGAQVRAYRRYPHWVKAYPEVSRDDKLRYILNEIYGAVNVNLNRYENNIEAILEEGPDYIIFDTLCFFGKMIAEKYRIPSISSIPIMLYNDSIIDANPKSFLKNILLFPESYLNQCKSGELYKHLFRVLTRQMASHYSLKKFNLLDVFNSYGDLNIVFTSKLFQRDSDRVDENFRFVGCSLSERPDPFDFSLLKDSYDYSVLISLGTTYVNERLDFYQTCIQAFSNTNIQVVMAVGTNIDIGKLGPIPQNIIVRPIVPQLELLKRVDLFITHGGANSANESCYFGVPMIVFPLAGDQFDIAERVCEVGAGIRADISDVTPERLKKMTDVVYHDESYSRHCRLIGDSLREAGGYQKAVAEIMEFIKTKIDREGVE